jgi:putative glutamine amidotransferase
MTPLIAIPGRLHAGSVPRNDAVTVPRRYLDALDRAGAVGAVLSPCPAPAGEVLARFDGQLLVGGGDVDPARYGASTRHPEVAGVQAPHDEYELAALRWALEAGVPVLAICRGCQILNVGLGGTLHQHVEGHRDALQPIEVAAGSRTALALGTTSPVGACRHHQTIDRVGDGLVVTATAGDGGVEGVELADGDRWVVGVQWHPEDTAATDPAEQALITSFVRRCAESAAAQR